MGGEQTSVTKEGASERQTDSVMTLPENMTLLLTKVAVFRSFQHYCLSTSREVNQSFFPRF